MPLPALIWVASATPTIENEKHEQSYAFRVQRTRIQPWDLNGQEIQTSCAWRQIIRGVRRSEVVFLHNSMIWEWSRSAVKSILLSYFLSGWRVGELIAEGERSLRYLKSTAAAAWLAAVLPTSHRGTVACGKMAATLRREDIQDSTLDSIWRVTSLLVVRPTLHLHQQPIKQTIHDGSKHERIYQPGCHMNICRGQVCDPSQFQPWKRCIVLYSAQNWRYNQAEMLQG